MSHTLSRAAVVLGGAIAVAVLQGGTASAAPTCSDSTIIDVQVHGEHIVGDYVTGSGHDAITWPPAGQVGDATGGEGAAVPGGPGPAFHFVNEVPPGASFCLEQSNSPGSPPGHDVT
jgi:hypothetical protein